jgi:hypothetical protein
MWSPNGVWPKSISYAPAPHGRDWKSFGFFVQASAARRPISRRMLSWISIPGRGLFRCTATLRGPTIWTDFTGTAHASIAPAEAPYVLSDCALT